MQGGAIIYTYFTYEEIPYSNTQIKPEPHWLRRSTSPLVPISDTAKETINLLKKIFGERIIYRLGPPVCGGLQNRAIK